MVRWSKQALASVEEIVRYIYPNSPEAAINVRVAIRAKATWLSLSELNAATGILVKQGLSDRYRRTYVLRRAYAIYYKIQGPHTIKILLVYNPRRKQPTVAQILAAEK